MSKDKDMGVGAGAGPLLAGHTPLPWAVRKLNTQHWITAAALDGFTGNRMAICELNQWAPGIGPTARDQAVNAAFIVRACNNYHDQLAALTEAERFLDYFANGRTSFVGGGTPATALEKVRAAISKAEAR